MQRLLSERTVPQCHQLMSRSPPAYLWSQTTGIHDSMVEGFLGAISAAPLPQQSHPKTFLLGIPPKNLAYDPDCTEWKERPRKHVKDTRFPVPRPHRRHKWVRPKQVDARDLKWALPRTLGPLAGARLIPHTRVTKPLPAGQEKNWAADPNEDIRQE